MEQAEFRGLAKQAMSRAAKDTGFRAALVADPVATFESTYRVPMPEGFNTHRFRENVQSRFGVASANDELDDAQLEGVAGGGCRGCFDTCACSHP